MALRQIRTQGDDILAKECRKVEKMTPKIRELIDDMFDTMYEAYGVGLAAPQVGILKQIVVIDTTGEDPIVLINPEILETSGSQTGEEGCLSVPGMAGTVTPVSYTHLCRDKIGVKPLYYTLFKNKIFFGSTIQDVLENSGIEAVVTTEGLCEIFALGPAKSRTADIFQGISEVIPAQYVVFQEGKLQKRIYWKLESFKHKDSFPETVEKTRCV